MSDPEPDDLFRARLLRVVDEKDRHVAQVGVGAQLDRLGRKYDVFRTGVPLKGFEGFQDDVTGDDA
ncbi:hypothetical protein [Heyndrickxia sporothermodurans]